jgi:phosphoribosylamine---glycine ligase
MSKILLLGSGGRECAIAWKLSQSPLCELLLIAPGNAGTAAYGTNVPIDYNDFEAVKQLCTEHQIDLVFPGPEEPLVNGMADFFATDPQLQYITFAGPSQQGAQLEGSKGFAKVFMARHNIPTAHYQEFTSEELQQALAYVRQHSLPVVIKADGLAAGKGVVIANDVATAEATITSMLADGKFGTAGSKVVVEEFLTGIELSVFVLTDGVSHVLLPEAKDYKRIGEGDTGPNTGGMGAISPVPLADARFMEKVQQRVVLPTINGLKAEQIDYVGIIFLGLIRVGDDPFVIEYNCRLGDPETEVVIPRLQNDLVALLQLLGRRELASVEMKLSGEVAATVMLVSGGYPDDYKKGIAITGSNSCNGCLLFHAGTKQVGDAVVTNGGRVMAITTLAPTLEQALATSYQNAALIDYEGKYYRKDIGWEFIGVD